MRLKGYRDVRRVNVFPSRLYTLALAVAVDYMTRLPPHGGAASGSLIDGTSSRALMASGIYGSQKTDCSCILGRVVLGDKQP